MTENNDSKTLTRIDSHVRDFAESPDDTTLLCVLRLLAVVYELKADEMHRAIEREEEKKQMTDEQINVAIAKACGWAHAGVKPYAFPNYCNDLNAMHEAEETLPDGELWTMKYNLPSQRGLEFRSTARERAEAFLRTLGKWEEAE